MCLNAVMQLGVLLIARLAQKHGFGVPAAGDDMLGVLSGLQR
jgi:hypothetical protein